MNSPTEYGLLGVVVCSLLAVLSWVLRSTIQAFVSELAAARDERRQMTERIATVIGESTSMMGLTQQTFVGFASEMGSLGVLLRDHEHSARCRFQDLRASMQRLSLLVTPPNGGSHEDAPS